MLLKRHVLAQFQCAGINPNIFLAHLYTIFFILKVLKLAVDYSFFKTSKLCFYIRKTGRESFLRLQICQLI